MVAVVTVVSVIGLVATIVDIFVTVLKPGADGFLAYRITNTVWRVARSAHAKRASHRTLANVGLALVAVLPLIWLSMMWLTWSLIYLVNEDSVLNATTRQPSDGWSKVYFAGYTLFTSGLGDHVPGSSLWQIVTVLTTAMGLGLITLAVTFLVPVLQAANARRSCARSISRIGSTTGELVERVDVLRVAASSIATSFGNVAEQHTSYPMLDHLHTQNERNALSVQLDHLHGALEMIDVDDDTELRLLDASLADFVETITPGPDDDQDGLGMRLRRLRSSNGWPRTT